MSTDLDGNEVGIEVWPAGRELHRSIQERVAALLDEQYVTVRCASCPDFRVEAPLAKSRALFRAHVEQEHPERLGALNRKRRPMTVVKPRKKDESDFSVLRELDRVAVAA